MAFRLIRKRRGGGGCCFHLGLLFLKEKTGSGLTSFLDSSFLIFKNFQFFQKRKKVR